MRVLILILMLCAMGAATAQAYNYLPLDEGNTWPLECLENPLLSDTWNMLGEEGGLRIHQRIYAFDNVPFFEHNWLLSHEDDGSVFIHAQVLPGETEFTYFHPPGALIQAPLAAGVSWTNEALIGDTGNTIRTEYECLEEGVVEVMIGEFYAYRVSRTVYWNDAFQYVTHEWYSDGYGVVRTTWPDDGETYEVLVVPVEQSTLTSVKALFK